MHKNQNGTGHYRVQIPRIQFESTVGIIRRSVVVVDTHTRHHVYPGDDDDAVGPVSGTIIIMSTDGRAILQTDYSYWTCVCYNSQHFNAD